MFSYERGSPGGGGSYERGTPVGLLGRDIYNHQHGRHVCTPMYMYKGTCTSPIRNRTNLGPYSKPMPRALWLPGGGGDFL